MINNEIEQGPDNKGLSWLERMTDDELLKCDYRTFNKLREKCRLDNLENQRYRMLTLEVIREKRSSLPAKILETQLQKRIYSTHGAVLERRVSNEVILKTLEDRLDFYEALSQGNIPEWNEPFAKGAGRQRHQEWGHGTRYLANHIYDYLNEEDRLSDQDAKKPFSELPPEILKPAILSSVHRALYEEFEDCPWFEITEEQIQEVADEIGLDSMLKPSSES